MSSCVSEEVGFIPHIGCHTVGIKCYTAFCMDCGEDIISDCQREVESNG